MSNEHPPVSPGAVDLDELEARGYDITTLRFEVLRKKKGGPDEG